MGAGGKVIRFRAPSCLQRSWRLSTSLDNLNRGSSFQQLLLKLQRWFWLTCEGSSVVLFSSSVLSWGPLAGADAGGAAVTWLMHKGIMGAPSTAGMMMAIGHVQVFGL